MKAVRRSAACLLAVDRGFQKPLRRCLQRARAVKEGRVQPRRGRVSGPCASESAGPNRIGPGRLSESEHEASPPGQQAKRANHSPRCPSGALSTPRKALSGVRGQGMGRKSSPRAGRVTRGVCDERSSQPLDPGPRTRAESQAIARPESPLQNPPASAPFPRRSWPRDGDDARDGAGGGPCGPDTRTDATSLTPAEGRC
jgi:hypothetical protein